MTEERICGIDLYGVYRKGRDIYRVVTVCEYPTMTLENVDTGQRVGGAIGAPIFDGFVELVPVIAPYGSATEHPAPGVRHQEGKTSEEAWGTDEMGTVGSGYGVVEFSSGMRAAQQAQEETQSGTWDQ